MREMRWPAPCKLVAGRESIRRSASVVVGRASPNLTKSAGTTTTQHYDIDAVAGQIDLQDPPNNGTLAIGRPLGVTGTTANGFDIDPRTNTGYAALGSLTASPFYTINRAERARPDHRQPSRRLRSAIAEYAHIHLRDLQPRQR